MDTPQIDDFILWLGAIAGAIVATIGAIAAVKWWLLGDLRKDMEDINSQLHRNGGSSLRDAVDRIEERQQNIQGDVRDLRNRVDDHIAWHLEHSEERAKGNVRTRHDD